MKICDQPDCLLPSAEVQAPLWMLLVSVYYLINEYKVV
jgi:hypothetical protein